MIQLLSIYNQPVIFLVNLYDFESNMIQNTTIYQS